jgi:hypothetical protein
MDSLDDTACAVGCPIRRSEDHRALAPPLGFSQRATSFIASRCQGIHQMPFMCRARAQPQARGHAACRDQMSEVRGQKAPHPATRPRLCFPTSALWSPVSGAGAQTPPLPMLAHRQHIPMPRSNLIPLGMMAGPASRSRLASRFQKCRDQMSEVRGQITNGSLTGRVRFRHLSSERHSDDTDARRQKTPCLGQTAPRSVARHRLTSDL